METSKPNRPFRGSVAIVATACLIAPLAAGEPNGGNGLAERETARRSSAVQEAQELLRKGDEAYNSGRFADAVEAYAGARDLLPDAPLTAELRAATTERYAQASVEAARVLSRGGDVAGAKALVDKVLAKGVAPNDPGALAFRAQLDDPIRTNPALTAEHAKNVDSVRRLLYTAEGAFNLGKFDQANANYADVLRIDPTNTAARRGMEQVEVAKSRYQEAAYDHTRARMLSRVDKQWELQAPPAEPELALTNPYEGQVDRGFVSVKNKIERLIIPRVDLDQSSLEEAIDFLRVRSSEGQEGGGVNFAVNLGPPDSPTAKEIKDIRFSLHLKSLPLSQVLKYITELTHTTFTTDDFAVIIKPAGSVSNELVLRTYRVPPDFISNISTETQPAAAADPFAEAPAGGGILPQRMGVQEALTKQGVTFPEGASASYIVTSNLLRVINTETNQDYISQIVETMAKTEPVMVSISVTMIKVQETHLEELGFDWLLDNFGFGGSSWVPGAAKYNLSGGTVGNGDSLDDIALPPGETIRNPITSGNRSGDSAISGNSIDELVRNPLRGRQSSARAPGVLGVRGDISNATVQMLMRGLDQKKGVDVMARPATVTRSGQSSSVAIVREMLYPTEYEPPELPNSTAGVDTGLGFSIGGGGVTPVTPATPTAFEKHDVGISMEVLPVADPNKQIVNVTLSPTFSDFDGFVNYGSPINTTQTGPLGEPQTVPVTDNTILMPVFSKQSFSTSVDVMDGATIVAGGLMQESVQNVEDQTPILGSVPIIGRLFQSKARQPVSTALLFLVHVDLMDPTGRLYRDR